MGPSPMLSPKTDGKLSQLYYMVLPLVMDGLRDGSGTSHCPGNWLIHISMGGGISVSDKRRTTTTIVTQRRWKRPQV
jgi:hypothetical protein